MQCNVRQGTADAFYKMVLIRESRRKVAAAGARNDSDYLMELAAT